MGDFFRIVAISQEVVEMTRDHGARRAKAVM